MHVVADLHLHSKYARAVSKFMDLPYIAQWCRRKGVQLASAGDFTHPAWSEHLRENLQEIRPGIFTFSGVEFLLGTEIACMYRQGGRLRRIHHLVYAPSFKAVAQISAELAKRGADLTADGRPVTELSSIELLRVVLDAGGTLIPAHLWTPWFGTFGSKTGFDSLVECFGELAGEIRAIETGLSSDPLMNWRVPELNSRQIVSFSDAHSGPKIAREATVLELPKGFTYADALSALTVDGIAYTIEFFPEEGKYHWSGHREHGVRFSPQQDREHGGICPVCGRRLTIGVENQAEQLGGNSIRNEVFDMDGFRAIRYGERPPFVSLVPLLEILQDIHRSPTKAQREYDRLVANGRSELELLMRAPLFELGRLGGERLETAVKRMRNREVELDPGYDGVFGQVSVLPRE